MRERCCVWHGSTQSTALTAHTSSVTHSVKFLAMKLEPFADNVETWSRFLEKFRCSIDDDATPSTINKHVFLRGYLEGEPKMLVDGIAVTASTYEETKRILLARYGDTNRIIQAHLNFLEGLPPAKYATPDEHHIYRVPSPHPSASGIGRCQWLRQGVDGSCMSNGKILSEWDIPKLIFSEKE
jgi:hypothetical protein